MVIKLEKITELEAKSILTTHSFYCDKCNKHIMDSVEYDDGYYDEPDRLQDIYCDCWLTNNMVLCDDCRQETILLVKEELKKLGYKEGC